ncbi:MAG: dihydrolipoyllysine-residue succinyltransferase [Gemmatimonadetes bacterium]|nr:dihydrolipoyllysine-residue succinyltransferase [Gemmatimonadota bacterium]|tara:strand:- start:7014 stop:8222 length:1209 start_codon:yes stop_codon:yes gene_type:complete
MAVNVEIPELGESVTEAILVEWLKQDGDRVEVDESVCVIETDKADAELPATAAGVVTRVKAEGDTVQVGDTVATIDESGAGSPAAEEPSAEAAAEPDAGATASPPQEDGLSPAVRRLVTEHGLNPEEIQGSGKDGRLTKEDVENHLSSADGGAKAEEAPVAPPASAVPAVGGERREPMSRLRKRLATNLVTAQHTAAMLTTFNEVDMSAIFELRGNYKGAFAEKHGISLGLMSFFVRASVLALQEFENVNASIEDVDIVYHDYVNMGIAVSTPKGLVVPVLKNADQMSFATIESEIKRVALAGREGKLSIPDLSGGTFTITNGGVFGSMLSTPILNPPQTGILGMHSIQNRPVAVGDQVEVRPVMYLALTYDHRLVDGRDSVTWLVRVKELLEDPARMMLEV